MIITTNTTAFGGLAAASPPAVIIPTATEIQSLIGASAIASSTAITSAFKALLIDISNNCLTGSPPATNKVKDEATIMFAAIGFHKTGSVMAFNATPAALAYGTELIINKVTNLTTIRDIAFNAFHNNTWAARANDIRAMAGSGLKSIHHLSIFDNTDLQGNTNLMQDIKALNLKDESTGRFTKITLNAAADSVMPTIRVFNNTNDIVRFLVKVEHVNYAISSWKTNNNNPRWVAPESGTFGPAQPYDIDNDGQQETNENIYLNRRFTYYFPTQTPTQTISINLPAQQATDINFLGKIRGGTAELKYVPGPVTTPWDANNTHLFKFYIRGTNPNRQQIRNYLTASNYLQDYWFMTRKIRQESGSGERFNGIYPNVDTYEFRHFDRKTTAQNYSLRLNKIMGLPVFGFPRGFGLSQTDNFGQANNTEVPTAPAIGDTLIATVNGQLRTVDFARKVVISDDDTWNWKRNIDIGVFVLESKIATVITKITEIRTKVTAWNNAHPQDKVIIPPPINYETIQYSWVNSNIAQFVPYNNLFLQGTAPIAPAAGTRAVKSFFDAMLIKSYNGNSGGGLFMDISGGGQTKPQIIFHLLNSRNENYVELVSNRDD